MFLNQFQEQKEYVIRDFMTYVDRNLPSSVAYGDIVTDNVILVYNEETEAFWLLSVKDFKNGLYGNAGKIDSPILFWEYMRSVYRSEQKGLIYRRMGARAYVYNMETFRRAHPYTAAEIILWDSEQMDHLLMKYDREAVEVSFAIQYMKYPQIEKLYKAGFEDLILNWVLRDQYSVRDCRQFEKCFPNEKSIRQITGMSKGQWSQLLSFKLELDEWEWIRSVLSVYKIDDVNVIPLVRMMIRGDSRFRRSFLKILECTKNGKAAYEADQLVRDLINDHGNTGLSSHEACIYLADYIRLCRLNGMEPDYRSEHLREEHDLMSVIREEKKQKKNDEETQRIYDVRYEQLKKYLFESDELAVVLPAKFSDIIFEGRNNHNCVGSLYVSRYENGTSNIFFIREKTNMMKSYITVELNAKCDKTIQAFYSYNRKITEERDLKFIKEWLAHNRRVNKGQNQTVLNLQ